jgi:hypothetical protein
MWAMEHQIEASAVAGRRVESLLSDSFLIFGLLAIHLAPLALAPAKPGPGGEGWTILTLLCCTFAAGFFFFRLRSVHRACSVAFSTDMRDDQANEL